MSWIRKLWDNLATEPADLFLLEALRPEQGAPTRRPLDADEDYISIFVRSLYVPFRRLNITAFHGTVMSELSLASSDTGEASFHVVTSPKLLRSSDSANLANVIQVDLVLLSR